MMPRKLTKQEALEIYGIDIDNVVKRDDDVLRQVRIRKSDDTPLLFDDVMKQRRQQQWIEENYAVRKANEPRADTDEQRTNIIDDSDKVSAKIKDLAASMIAASSGKITEQQATHFILNTPHGRKMYEHFSKSRKDNPMHINIHKLMPAIEIMEEGLQARAKLERHDGESVAKSFTRLYEGDLDFRRTCKTVQEAKHFVALTKVNVMPTSVVSTEVGNTNVPDDSAKAIAQLNAQAERAHRTFEEEFLDPANAGLAEATYRRPTASSTSGSELQRR